MKYVTTLVLMFFSSVLPATEYNIRLQADSPLTLGVMVSGVVREIKVEEGQTVKQGQLLLELDQREFKSELQRAKARAKRANSLFEEALREEERAQELYDRTLLSDHDLQKALIGRLEAESRKFEAAADLMRAKLAWERSRILAPAAGTIRKIHAWKGRPLQNALSVTPLLEFEAANKVQFNLRLPKRTALKRVRLRVDGTWYPVRSYTFKPDPAGSDSWILNASLSDSGAKPGKDAVVSIE